jgi:NADPH:quinone reductase-like Zn-dependent oxidoreductase
LKPTAIVKGIILNQSLPDKIEQKEIQLPELKDFEVRVKVKSAALNHRDEWCRQGLYPTLKNGVVLGSDCSGVVDAVGNQEDSHWIGKEVIVNPGFNWGDNQNAQSKEFRILGMPDHGTFAEYVQVPAHRLHPKPAHLNFDEAAGLPLCGVTAFRAVSFKGQVKKGDKVLVTGFGGGVAQFATQLAISMGAEVYVSSSSESKIQHAKELGAKDGFDYRKENWTETALAVTQGFDVIIDSAMGDTLSQLIKVLKPGGRIVIYGATMGDPPVLEARKLFWNQIQIIGTTMGSDRDFEEMLEFVNKHKINPVVDEVFELKDAVKAFDKMRAGLQTGKIILKID